jgi:hypothetical protein
MDPRLHRDAMIAHLPAAAGVDDGMDGRSVLPVDLREHLANDPQALEEWHRLVDQARGLRSLERRPVPEDLEGRVVAALNSGHRQDRVMRWLGRLGRAQAPEALRARVRRLAEQPFALPGVSAPPVLDRLVEEEVRDPQHTQVRRMTARLERRRAPRGLARRLESLGRGDEAAPVRRSRLLPLAALLVAVGLAWGGLRRLAGDGTVEAKEWPFRVVRLQSVEDADPVTQELLDTLGAGMLGGVAR